MDRTVVYDVADAKVYPLTSDPAGGSPTYGAAVDVPGFQQVELTPSYESNSLDGDGRRIDKRTKLQAVSLSFRYAKLDPAVLAVIDGGTVSSNTGGTIDRYRRAANDAIPYFGFAALVTEVDAQGGAAKLYVYKAKVEDGTLFGSESNDYGTPEFDAEAVYLNGTSGALWQADLEDTESALPADLATTLAALA